MTASGTNALRERQRRLGAYYTPGSIVRWMVRTCIDHILKTCDEACAAPLRILDPACGDGAFLVGLSAEWSRREFESGFFLTADGADPCERNHRRGCWELYGVDIDRSALRKARRRLADDAAIEQHLLKDPRPGLSLRLQWGDALRGEDFREDCPAVSRSMESQSIRAIPWKHAFPDVAAAGGFDLVIGNPPYRREKGARDCFGDLAQTDLGRRWGQPRMDLWHYFLHRGLDLLRPGGTLCFIVSEYWMSSRSARRMIERLNQETTLMHLVLLGDAPLFPKVSGRHMILQLQKGTSDAHCRVIDLRLERDPMRLLESAAHGTDLAAHSRLLPQPSLYSRSGLTPGGSERRSNRKGSALGDLFDVRQGIAENPPRVTAAMQAELGNDLTVGSGVFVLTRDEVRSLPLAPDEKRLLRPYFPARSIERYSPLGAADHWLLYLTRRTAPEIARFPNVLRHLARFAPVLRRRREVQRGRIGWWHLHWPREERLFIEPKILALQMCARPTFVYIRTPAFVGFSVNVIRCRGDAQRSVSLEAATAVLNSRRSAAWFAAHAKRRGVGLDISGTLLRELPFPELSVADEQRLASWCRERQELARLHDARTSEDVEHRKLQLEKFIDELLAAYEG